MRLVFVVLVYIFSSHFEGRRGDKNQIFLTLDGPNLNKLLRPENLDSLEEFVDPQFHNFVECLRCFALVAESCFGMVLSDDWEANIHVFQLSYLELDISVTPKAQYID